MTKIPGVLIAAPSSGSGKTITACGLMAAFGQMGKNIRACKCGPDYIDPMFHRTVLGIKSENLDLFFSSKEELREIYQGYGNGADLVITEGVMGYYDGISFGSTNGSAWDTAGALELPVILVVPCRGMASSVLALLHGFLEYKKDSHIRGIILNRISPMLYPRMKEMLENGLKKMGHPEIQILGFLPEKACFRLESRHLGLVTPQELTGLKKQLQEAGQTITETVDLAQILEIAAQAETWTGENQIAQISQSDQIESNGNIRQKVRVAVARDAAFCFYYKENMKLMEQTGCELVPFSPLEDEALPEGCGGLILGGGYPELYGARLEVNEGLRREIREKIADGMPCLAECGGFQYLQDSLTDAEGRSYRMAGVISSESSNQGRLVRFGYVTIEAEQDGAFLKKGEQIRAHEFHHWDSTDNGKSCLAVKPDGKRSWQCIHMNGNLMAGYPHLYYRSYPKLVERYVKACEVYAGKESRR